MVSAKEASLQGEEELSREGPKEGGGVAQENETNGGGDPAPDSEQQGACGSNFAFNRENTQCMVSPFLGACPDDR